MKWINTNHALPEGDEVVLALTTGGEYLMLEYTDDDGVPYWGEQNQSYGCHTWGNHQIACWARPPEVTDLTEGGDCSFNQMKER